MNALTIYKDFDVLQKAALVLYQSGYFSDSKSEAQAIVKVMAGSELGLPPFASMSGIHIIQNKPVLGANVIATLVKNDSRYDYRIKQADNDACVLTWYENGEVVGEAGFTIQEATEAGLAGKDNWKKYASDMLFARAISRGARRFAPGIFGGAPVYTPEEAGVDTDEEGFIEVKVVEVTEDEPKEAANPEEKKPIQKKKKPAPEQKHEISVKKGSIALTKPLNEKDWAPLADFVSIHPDLTGEDMNQIRKDHNDDALLVFEYLKENYA